MIICKGCQGICLHPFARGAANTAQSKAPAVAGNIAGAPDLKGGVKVYSMFSFATTAEDTACRLSNILDAYWLLFEVLSRETYAAESSSDAVRESLCARMPAFLSTLLVIFDALNSEKQALEQLQNDLYAAAFAEKK